MFSIDMYLILIALAIVWYWIDGMKAKELARQVGRDACKQANVIFLDDTVVVTKVRPRRNSMGQMSLYREYQFEFTSDGEYRRNGQINILGKRVLKVEMDPYPLN